jgi:hypothetical protein
MHDIAKSRGWSRRAIPRDSYPPYERPKFAGEHPDFPCIVDEEDTVVAEAKPSKIDVMVLHEASSL